MPGLAPPSAGFATCPIVLNRCRYHPFEIYLNSIDVLLSRDIPILPYGYLLVTPAQSTSIGKVLEADVVDRTDLASIQRLSSVAKILGLRTLVLEAGSGPAEPIVPEVVSTAREGFEGFLLAGGGISNSTQIINLINAGANSTNIGGALEKAESIDDVMRELCRSHMV